VLDWGTFANGAEGTVPFMVMEYVLGQTLKEANLAHRKPRPPKVVVPWIIAILEGLQVAHDAGIVHRDIKPANLMLTTDGHVKIMDFGVAASAYDRQLTVTDQFLGTPAYMSPEHVDARHILPSSDVYSLASVAYECMAGQPLYTGTTLPDMASQVMSGTHTPIAKGIPRCPPGLAAVLERMLERHAEDRFPDARSAAAALRALRLR
jgi:serine/threonine-protein kinase